MFRLKHFLISGPIIVLSLFLPGKSHAATNWQIHAGAGFGQGQMVTMKFYPPTITIDQGDSITWTVSGDAHTISFLSGGAAPDPFSPQAQQPAGGGSYDGSGFISSGIVDPGKTYTLSFTKAGTYTYQCLIHPGMTATVVVQAPGTAYPHNQNFYDQQYQLGRAHDIAAGSNLYAAMLPPFPTLANDGSRHYAVTAGIGNGTESVMRFSHPVLVVHQGDSVTWTNRDAMMPHTVTFPAGTNFGENFNPVGGSSFDGSTPVSSGILMPNQTYTLSFTKPGRYSYECLLHDELGMKGTIIVVPKP